jgi:hypothetical protein
MLGETQISDRLAYQLAGVEFAQFRSPPMPKPSKYLIKPLFLRLTAYSMA